MLSSNTHSTITPRTHLYPSPSLNKCIECQKPVIESYQTKPRFIRRFGGFQEIIEHIFTCQTESCSQVGIKLYPERQTPPKSSYHFEVIYEVGRLRKQCHYTFNEIIVHLQEQQVPIGENSSCAHHIFQYYEIYEHSWQDKDLSVECQGQDVVLAVDGVKPENGASTLYLVTNAKTKEVYASEWLLYSGTKEISQLLHQVKQLDLNITGFISDKQRSLLLGVQSVFGEIAHQYCQYHWFQAAFQPLCDLDRALNKQLKKGVRQLRTLTRTMKDFVKSGKLPPLNLQFLQELEPYITILLQAKNKPPFVLKGKQAWERLKSISIRILTILETHHISVFDVSTRQINPEYKSLVMAVRIIINLLEKTIFTAKEITTASKWLRMLEKYMNPHQMPLEWQLAPNCEHLAETRILKFLAHLESSTSDFLRKLHLNLGNTFQKWNQGLLKCFQDSKLPRTNNSLEQFIYQVKRRQVKISGRRNNHLTLRYRQNFRDSFCVPDKPEFLHHCSQLLPVQYQSYRLKRLEKIEPLRQENRIKRNFSRMLDLTFGQIRQEVNFSSVCT